MIVRVRNYGKIAKTVSVTLNLGHAPQGGHAIELPAGAEREITFPVHAVGAGILEARLYPRDAFAADNFVALELPEVRSLNVTVYTEKPGPDSPGAGVPMRV